MSDTGAEQRAKGDEFDERADAFRRLTDEELDYSYRLANAILSDPTEAEDVVHDAVLTAWQKWRGLRDPSKFGAWFRRIVVNKCRDRLRRSSRFELTDITAQTGLASPDSTGPIAERVAIEQALHGLPADDRIVLALRYARDLKLDDAARYLGIPTPTFKSRLRAAHDRLRARLTPADERTEVR